MNVRGEWLIGPAVAVLVAACGAAGTPSTSPSAVPTAASAAVGSAAASQGATAPVVGVSPSPAGASAVAPSATTPPAATPTATAAPTARPSPSPSPRPKPTPTHAPASSPPPNGGQAVGIADFAFSPSSVTVRVGTRVTWTNSQPAIQHTVTADGGSFGSDPLATGSSFSHVFATVGTYAYHCSIHPEMAGTVTVTR